MKRCLVYLFLCLSKIGFRGVLLRIFAFRPPNNPTYTLRVRDKGSKKTKTMSWNAEPRNSALEPYIMRIHRIGSHITEKDSRPYTIPSDQDQVMFDSDFSNEGSEVKLPSYIADSFTRASVQRPVYELKLINIKRQVIDIADPDDLRIDSYYIETTTNNTIPLLFIQTNEVTDYVIIYSHPNSTDLGLMLDNYLDLAYNLKINILGYDYTGYGQSTGKADDINVMADIEAVYLFATRELGFAWEKIILYGQSIGSGPSVTLAADHRHPVGGLIIHSGFSSGLRVLCPGLKKTPYDDFFPNIDLMQYVNCSVYIFHGQKDLMISAEQAVRNSDQARNLYRVWLVEEGGHNNIEYANRFRKEYFLKLRDFLREVKVRNSFYQQDELLKLHRAAKWDRSFEHCYRDRVKTDSTQYTKKSSFLPEKNPDNSLQMNDSSSFSQIDIELVGQVKRSKTGRDEDLEVEEYHRNVSLF